MTESQTNGGDGETDQEGFHASWSTDILLISDGQDTDEEESGGDGLLMRIF